MRSKEVQLLGVLAVIAGGIIAISIWTGGPVEQQKAKESEEPVPENKSARSTEAKEIEEWLWLAEDGKTAREVASNDNAASGEAGNIEIGGKKKVDDQKKSKSKALDELLAHKKEEPSSKKDLAETEPSEIPLTSGPSKKDSTSDKKEPKAEMHVVKKGETLSAISSKYYGTPSKWKRILKANSDVLDSPKTLRPEMVLVIPEPAEQLSSADEEDKDSPMLSSESKEEKPSTDSYTVKKGDSLWRIAREVYGNGSLWRKILEANSDKIQSPSDLKAGMDLVIPDRD